jgi:hypothetical protein
MISRKQRTEGFVREDQESGDNLRDIMQESKAGNLPNPASHVLNFDYNHPIPPRSAIPFEAASFQSGAK